MTGKPKSKKRAVSPEYWQTADSIRTLQSLGKYLCNGFQSKCENCECLEACGFGKRWRDEWDFEKPEKTEAEQRHEDGLNAQMALRALREANGLCRTCGAVLPKRYEYKNCQKCLDANYIRNYGRSREEHARESKEKKREMRGLRTGGGAGAVGGASKGL